MLGGLIGHHGWYDGRMKNHSCPRDLSEVTPFPATPEVEVETPDLILGNSAPATVRILLGVDVPVAALAAIEADWALVAARQGDAPELARAVIVTALARLQQQVVNVSGVAVAERLPNRLARWVRAA